MAASWHGQADKFAKKMAKAALDSLRRVAMCSRHVDMPRDPQELQWVPPIFGPKKEKLPPGRLLRGHETRSEAYAAHVLLQPQVPGALKPSAGLTRPAKRNSHAMPRHPLARCEAKTEGAKCRCDAVWYGDTIAYGCKTSGEELSF